MPAYRVATSEANACRSWCGPTATTTASARIVPAEVSSTTPSATTSTTRDRVDVFTAWPRATSHCAARSGIASPRPLRGTTVAVAAAPAPNVSRSTFRNDCAEARCGGVLSAATQSGAHRLSRTRGESSASKASTVVAGSQRKPRPRWRANEAGGEPERARKAVRRERDGVVLSLRERSDRERRDAPCGTRVAVAQRCRERERVDVRAKQQVLAVVERQSVPHDAARAAADAGRRLVQRDAVRALRELDRGRAAGPARANDDYVSHAVRVAIHSLRNGVSAMRRSSTRYPSRAISSSSVR